LWGVTYDIANALALRYHFFSDFLKKENHVINKTLFCCHQWQPGCTQEIEISGAVLLLGPHIFPLTHMGASLYSLSEKANYYQLIYI